MSSEEFPKPPPSFAGAVLMMLTAAAMFACLDTTTKYLTRELLGVDLSKQQQSSDWAAETLTEAQLAYAASDVLHLHALKAKLEALLVRDGRADLAQACFGFLPARARLDLAGWGETDIFAHS